VYRNVTLADLDEAGMAVKVTDYWGEPFAPPAWRKSLTQALDMPRTGIWPAADVLTQD
jgi:hypothetical protein